MSKCVIVGAGEYFGEEIEVGEGDYVIAADAGLKLLEQLDITPDEVIGDFDSMGYVPDGPHVRRLPVEKDDTDTLYALRVGLQLGYDEFYIHGGTGGRLDHTIANIQCLTWLAEQGKRGWLYDHDSVLTALHNEAMTLKARAEGTVSVFAVNGPAEGVTIEGLKYEARDLTMTGTFPIGVSNAFVGREARIEVKRGTVLVCAPGGGV